MIHLRDEHRSEATAPIDPEDRDPADRANDDTGREVVVAELKTEEAELEAIDAALQRLREGSYGICGVTGKPISAARLRAIPWTRYSREAAARMEKTSSKTHPPQA